MQLGIDRRMLARSLAMVGLVVALAGLGVVGSTAAHGAAAVPVFAPAVKLPGADGSTEPRVSVGPGNHRWVVSNLGGTAVVYGSTDGLHWKKTATDMPDQVGPTIDVDIVTTATGRIIASELDTVTLSMITGYSDDAGATWTRTSSFALGAQRNGTDLLDQDRQWFAVGPVNPATHQQPVYMLFHNLATGAASHNMFVMTSTDSGATFGPPVPVTLPGSQAWLDLQCADSGGPSNIVVNQKTGQVYTVFGTRSSVLGGCGASVTGAFEVNVVAATRVWVATAPAAGAANPLGWSQSLAVDDSAAGKIVGMQLSYGALDSAGNVYVAYPESPRAYPDFSGAAVKYVHSGADMKSWSAPVTVATGGAGHNLVHLLAGDPGKLDFAYYTGVTQASGPPLWYATAAEVLDGMSANPHVEQVRLSQVAAYRWDPSAMMGACGSGPAQGVENGFACARSTDVWGVALDNQCNFVVTWPVGDSGSGGTAEAKTTAGTYVATQTAGPTVCQGTAAATTPAPVPPATGGGLPNSSAAPTALVGAGLFLVGAGVLPVLGRRRRGARAAR